jgi:hypothetical protein
MDRDNKNNEHKERSPSPPYRVWLCGAFRVERLVGMGEHSPIYEVLRTAEWGGSSYPRLLLKALLCLPRRQARREALLEMLWSGMDTSQAANNLNTATSKLRKVLGHAGEQGSVLITEDDPGLTLMRHLICSMGQKLLNIDYQKPRTSWSRLKSTWGVEGC